MDVKYISIKSVLEDYVDFSGEELQIPESVILKTANDTMQKILTGENLDMRIARLEVKNYQTMLPDGFRSVVQAMSRGNTPKCVTREEVVEWTQKIWGSDCELKINIECPDCHQDSCNCSSDIIIVDADRTWQDTHPEHYASKRYLYNFGRIGEPGYNPCQEFKLMRRTSNNFHSANYHIPGCVNLNFNDPTAHEYDISLPKMVTSFKDGEILLSYLSVVLDSDGYRMVIDHPRVHEALFYAIEERVMWRKYRMSGDAKFRDLFLLAEKKKNETISLARSAIQIPEYDKWTQFLRQHWIKFIPETMDRVDANLGGFMKDRYEYPKY